MSTPKTSVRVPTNSFLGEICRGHPGPGVPCAEPFGIEPHCHDSWGYFLHGMSLFGSGCLPGLQRVSVGRSQTVSVFDPPSEPLRVHNQVPVMSVSYTSLSRTFDRSTGVYSVIYPVCEFTPVPPPLVL